MKILCRIKINRKIWTCRLLSSFEFYKIHRKETTKHDKLDEEILALTDSDNNMIDFRIKYFNKNIILHELFHAYCGSYIGYGDYSKVSAFNFEEKIAVMLGNNWREMNKQVVRIHDAK